MGLVYSSTESSQLIQALTVNLKSGHEAISQLRAGCHSVIAAVDGKTLAGAAYTAGKDLFSELIIPTIMKVVTSIDSIEQELQRYKAADRTISNEGYLDEETINQQIRIKKMMKLSVETTATVSTSATSNPSVRIVEALVDTQRNLAYMASSLQNDINELEEKLRKLYQFSTETDGLFSNSLNEMNIAMQGVMVLNTTIVNSDGSYSLPKGTDKSWFSKMHTNSNKILGQSSTNVFLELYKQTEALLKPIKGGKTDNIKRFEMLLKLYPASVVKKLLANDEFWMLANKLPSGWQTKLINGLAKYETFGQAVIQGKWIPKVDTLGKAFENFNKFTNPIKTWVGESLKNSQFVQGAKQWGISKRVRKSSYGSNLCTTRDYICIQWS